MRLPALKHLLGAVQSLSRAQRICVLGSSALLASFPELAASTLDATTIIGFPASGCSSARCPFELKLANSLLITLKSSTGSGLPDASDTSTR